MSCEVFCCCCAGIEMLVMKSRPAALVTCSSAPRSFNSLPSSARSEAAVKQPCTSTSVTWLFFSNGGAMLPSLAQQSKSMRYQRRGSETQHAVLSMRTSRYTNLAYRGSRWAKSRVIQSAMSQHKHENSLPKSAVGECVSQVQASHTHSGYCPHGRVWDTSIF